MNNRQTGNAYEQMAAEYLQKKGMIILDRNFRRGRNGEIDIVGRDEGNYLVLYEMNIDRNRQRKCGRSCDNIKTAKKYAV